MASLQFESGYTRISNEILEALAKVNFSAYETRVLFFLFRKTYGWGKATDWISLSQFSKCLGLDRRLIHRAIKGLALKGMLVIERDDGIRVKYGFQKNYEKWDLSSKGMTHRKRIAVISGDDGVSAVGMIRLSSKGIPTKEKEINKNTKETSPIIPLQEKTRNQRPDRPVLKEVPLAGSPGKFYRVETIRVAGLADVRRRIYCNSLEEWLLVGRRLEEGQRKWSDQRLNGGIRS